MTVTCSDGRTSSAAPATHQRSPDELIHLNNSPQYHRTPKCQAVFFVKSISLAKGHAGEEIGKGCTAGSEMAPLTGYCVSLICL